MARRSPLLHAPFASALALLLALAMTALARPADADDAIPLHRAVAEGHVSARVTGLGASSGDSLQVAVRRTRGQAVRLTLYPGTIFRSANPGAQDMAGARLKGERTGATTYRPASEVDLNDDSEHVLVVEAYCMDFHRANPSTGDTFTVSAPGPGLAALLSEAVATARPTQVVQAALWISREGISDAEIARRFPVTATDLATARGWLAELRRRPMTPAGRLARDPEEVWRGSHGGMRFPDGGKGRIEAGGVFVLEKEGIVGIDGEGNRWVSRRKVVGGKDWIVFVPDLSAPAPAPAAAPRPTAPTGRMTPATVEWSRRWVYVSPDAKGLPIGTHGITVRGTEDGGAEVKSPPGGGIAFNGSKMVFDGPGSRDIKILVDPAVGKTPYANLYFRAECVVAIQDDGTVTVDREGVSATDLDGRPWVSARVTGSAEVIALYPAR